jgi:DNA mismatch repair protein MutS2
VTFSAGASVIVLSINRRGEVEEEVRPRVYRVRVGAMAMTVKEDGLRAATDKKAGRSRVAPSVEEPARVTDAKAVRALASLDLHGLSVDDARNRVAGHISRAILAGLERVEIIHGIGTGRLKAAVTADLRSLPSVRRVAPHPTNPGVLIAYL